VSAAEHTVLGDVLLWALAALFVLGIPGYWLLRRWFPEGGWNHGGNVTTASLGPVDLVGIGGVICFVTMMWKGSEGLIGQSVPDLAPFTVVMKALTFGMFAAIIPAALFWRVSLREFFGLKWKRWLSLLWIIPVFLATMLLVEKGLAELGWRDWVTENGGGQQQSVSALQASSDWRLHGAIFFGAAIMAPLAEELIFRGYVYPVVKRFTERNFAMIFTGVLFGVAHLNLLGLPLLIIIGVAMVVVYEYTGSIWAPIACHMAFNTLQMAMMWGTKYMLV